MFIACFFKDQETTGYVLEIKLDTDFLDNVTFQKVKNFYNAEYKTEQS